MVSPDDVEQLETLSDREWIEVLLAFVRQLLARLAAIHDRTDLR